MEGVTAACSEVLESRQPLKMWKEQALAMREGEVQTTSPTTNDPLLARDGKGRAGLTQQLMTGRQAQAEGGLQKSRRSQAPTPQVFTVSRHCLEFKPSLYSHREPPQSTR